jgi:hypothetical protein
MISIALGLLSSVMTHAYTVLSDSAMQTKTISGIAVAMPLIVFIC